MSSRIVIVSIIVEDISSTDKVNEILHGFGDFIIGRMGIPYRKRGVSIISVVLDAPNDVITSMSGKLGMVKGISVKSVFSKKEYIDD